MRDDGVKEEEVLVADGRGLGDGIGEGEGEGEGVVVARFKLVSLGVMRRMEVAIEGGRVLLQSRWRSMLGVLKSILRVT